MHAGPRPRVPLSGETTGLDGIVKALIRVFDHVDILALGESHWNKLDSDLRIRLVRDPEFARKAHFIVVEFASTAQQQVLDRYVRGENVPVAELQRIWRNTTQTSGVWESPVYAEFLAAVREVNASLPPTARIRVLAGDPPTGSSIDRDASAVSVLKDRVLEKGGKALLVYGSAHLQRIGGITKAIEATHPGRIFVVDTLGGPYPAYERFERALKSPQRPVLISLTTPPFRDLSANQTLGRGMKKLKEGIWVNSDLYEGLTLGQLADACIYWGMGPDAETTVRPIR